MPFYADSMYCILIETKTDVHDSQEGFVLKRVKSIGFLALVMLLLSAFSLHVYAEEIEVTDTSSNIATTSAGTNTSSATATSSEVPSSSSETATEPSSTSSEGSSSASSTPSEGSSSKHPPVTSSQPSSKPPVTSNTAQPTLMTITIKDAANGKNLSSQFKVNHASKTVVGTVSNDIWQITISAVDTNGTKSSVSSSPFGLQEGKNNINIPFRYNGKNINYVLVVTRSSSAETSMVETSEEESSSEEEISSEEELSSAAEISSKEEENEKEQKGGTWLLWVGIALLVLGLAGIGYVVYDQFFCNKGNGPKGGGEPEDTSIIGEDEDLDDSQIVSEEEELSDVMLPEDEQVDDDEVVDLLSEDSPHVEENDEDWGNFLGKK